MSAQGRVHGVIHGAAAAAAGIGAGLAQFPGSDAGPLTALQTAMIVDIARTHRANLTEGQAASVLTRFLAVKGGRTLSQALLGWMPGAGNAINAATAAAVTEAIGWAAHAYFQARGPQT
jgi:uncharacterized protein (DUF697 family)